MELTFLRNIPVAHRGLHGDKLPENSIGAFRAAVLQGYAVETDVRLSKDGEAVLFHDDTLLRMTGADLNVSDCTAEELSLLRLNGTQERIPLFDELLAEAAGRVPLLIEIKNMNDADTDEFIRRVAERLAHYRGEFAIQSFRPAYVKAFKKLRPDVPCGILATASSTKADFGGSPIWKLKARAVRNMSFNRSVKPDFISYHFADYPQKSTEKFEGVKLAWTVRSEKDEEYARKYADNIIFEGYLAKK